MIDTQATPKYLGQSSGRLVRWRWVYHPPSIVNLSISISYAAVIRDAHPKKRKKDGIPRLHYTSLSLPLPLCEWSARATGETELNGGRAFLRSISKKLTIQWTAHCPLSTQTQWFARLYLPRAYTYAATNSSGVWRGKSHFSQTFLPSTVPCFWRS